MKLQRLLSNIRQAVDNYQMIAEGDCICVGISGGKDSLTLLYGLKALQRFYPNKFELKAISVDLGFSNFDLTPVQALCDKLEVPFTIIPTQIGEILFDIRKETNPCSLCAKMRKGVLNETAKQWGCNKIAYAHHKDDFIETMLLSLLFEGRFYSFPPYTYLDRVDLAVIRPLMYVNESNIINFKNNNLLPVCKNPCPVDGKTKREYAKNLIKQLNMEHPGAKDRMFKSIISGNIEGWSNGFKI